MVTLPDAGDRQPGHGSQNRPPTARLDGVTMSVGLSEPQFSHLQKGTGTASFIIAGFTASSEGLCCTDGAVHPEEAQGRGERVGQAERVTPQPGRGRGQEGILSCGNNVAQGSRARQAWRQGGVGNWGPSAAELGCTRPRGIDWILQARDLNIFFS